MPWYWKFTQVMQNRILSLCPIPPIFQGLYDFKLMLDTLHENMPPEVFVT